MITNARQYRTTKAQVEHFRQALEARGQLPSLVEPLKQRAMHDQYVSQIEELEEQLREYESLHGSGTVQLKVASLDRLPEALILARIAAGMTQRELGELLEVTPQQVQRDERTGYIHASFERLLRVARALHVELAEPATIAVMDEPAGPAGSTTTSERTVEPGTGRGREGQLGAERVRSERSS